MSSFMLVRHKVKDYATWKPVYDGHQPTRKAAGVSARQVFRSADDPNNVFVLFEVEDVGRAKAFGASTDLRETMMRAGVTEQPDIYFLSDAGK
jgi:hypothetical protein